MRRLAYNESKKAPESENVQKEERHSTGGDSHLKDELKFGEQLQDDLINSFCDKLQAVCPRRLEAFMAIQFLMIADIEDVRKHVTGKHPAMQVLYDRTRSHYVLVHYNPRFKKVEIYDSLQPWNKAGEPEILTELSTHISHLFGHLFTKYVPCVVDKEYEAQHDNFSCGYRVIGALVDLARQRNPAAQTYSRSAILDFMRTILAEPNPTWKMFESAKFGCVEEYSGEYRASIYLLNSTYTSSSTSISRTSCKRKSSVDSLASQKSDHSDGSSGSKGDTGRKDRKIVRRAHAGHQEYHYHLPENPFQQMEYMHPKPSDTYRQPFIPLAYRCPTYSGPPPYHVTALPLQQPQIQPTRDHGIFGYVRKGYQWMIDNIFRQKIDKDFENLEQGGHKE